MITLDMTVEELCEAVMDTLFDHLMGSDRELKIAVIHAEITGKLLDREVS